jgi:hypothetical protein
VPTVSRTLHLTLACSDYDRTRALRDGRVAVEGCDLTYLPLPVEETFFRMLRHREFDVAEMSLSSYVVSHVSADPWLVAIPVYPSRSFRHAHIAVRSDRVAEPADLVGKVVGTPEFQLTACVWVRGILADRHGLPVESVRYRTAGLETPKRPEKLKLDLPPAIDLAPLDAAAKQLQQSAKSFDAAYAAHVASGAKLAPQRRQEIDAAMARMEQALTDPDGLPGRGWYKHMIYAPGLLTGYGVKTVPGVREAIEQKQWSEANEQIAIVAKVLEGYVAEVDRATALAR